MKKERKTLLNGCSRTSVFISPKNYKSFTAKSKFPREWRVTCRFYDPNFSDQYPDGFQFRKKFTSDNLQELKIMAQLCSEEMEEMLDVKNYNPLTKEYMSEKVNKLHPYLPLIQALNKAHINLNTGWSIEYGKEVKRCINRVEKFLYFTDFPDILINEVRTWHIKTILDGLNLTNSMFNHSRSHLQALFKELAQYGCCDINPVDNVVKKAEEIKMRDVLTKEQMYCVHKFLKEKCYTFYRYGKIFFYSAGRTTELFKVKKCDVDLENQEYKVLIKKGKLYTWVKKIIIPAAIPYWKEILSECNDDSEFIFSKGLIPGEVCISPKQISRRWKRHVKDSDNIKDSHGNVIKVTADFYTHKHLFLDILDEMSHEELIPVINPAQRMSNHTRITTTNIYTQGKEARKNKDLKKLMVE